MFVCLFVCLFVFVCVCVCVLLFPSFFFKKSSFSPAQDIVKTMMQTTPNQSLSFAKTLSTIVEVSWKKKIPHLCVCVSVWVCECGHSHVFENNTISRAFFIPSDWRHARAWQGADAARGQARDVVRHDVDLVWAGLYHSLNQPKQCLHFPKQWFIFFFNTFLKKKIS